MKFTEEMVKSARECKSVDEIMGLAKDNGIDITEGEARSYFAKLNHANCELSNEELENVSGGFCDDDCEEYDNNDLVNGFTTGGIQRDTSLVNRYVNK